MNKIAGRRRCVYCGRVTYGKEKYLCCGICYKKISVEEKCFLMQANKKGAE